MTHAEPISVVGLGKLGLGFAACLARNGFNVLGVDQDISLVDRINGGAPAFEEPGVDDAIMAATGGTLCATSEIPAAARHSDTAFMLLPTPSRPDGNFDASALAQALADLCVSIREQNKQRYLIVIGSTVSPGTIAGMVVPIVERILQRPIGQTVSVCYHPEFAALGSVIADFERPDLILIGESDFAAGAEVERILWKIVRNNPPVHHMSFVNAEIAKLALNVFLTVKIGFANFISQICSRIDGAEIDAITLAIGDDSRIGGKYLWAGPAFGGPCLPRDIKALAALARHNCRPTGFLDELIGINIAQQELLTETVCRQVELSGVRSVGILGLSYNGTAPHVIESASLALIRALHARGISITAYDTLALKAAVTEVGELFAAAATAKACMHASPVVVLLNSHPAYIDAIVSYRGENAKVVVDCWRVLDPRVVIPNVRVVKFGFFT